MRKIEFRGKSVKNNLWYYGDLQINSIGDTWISELDCGEGDRGFFENVKWDTVGQLACIDRMKNKLYEGDIFHLGDPNIKYVIEWIDCGLKGRQISNNSFVGLEYHKNDIIKLGTIHDNKKEGSTPLF